MEERSEAPADPDAPRRPEDQTAVDLRGPSAAVVAADVDGVAPGTRIGRYMIVEVVGSGGVGVVYSAYDPDLDRKVALKQLRRSKLIGQTEAVNQRRTRLRREAQALARLSHPNVVPVYEVATVDDQIYVVMEFVEGQTLGEWLDEVPRSWAEIVGMFMQAGRGLVAAHEADIVHRDFKPDNVRVGTDGRARVLDFGLAGPLRDAEDSELSRAQLQELWERAAEESWSDSGSRSIEGQVTREGQVMGTPAYMAPEQASGGRVDARSDQFSFCVALYEALYGTRPFRGRFDNPRRFRNLAQARTIPGARPSDMPLDVERVLIRGLSLVPEQRFDSMQALLAELGAVASGPRRLWWVPVSIMLLALLAVIAFYERRVEPGVVCDDGDAMLEGVWDESVLAALGDAALASDRPYAELTWDNARQRLDDWSAQWSRERLRACEATHVQGEQSSALLERRVACLDLQLTRVESAVEGLRRLELADALLERLTSLELPSVDSCAAANVLERGSLEPREAEAAAEAEAIRQRLASVEGLTDVGEFGRAIAEAEAAVAQARALGFEPLTAEALLLLGLAIDRDRSDAQRSATILREAAWAAQRSGHARVLIRAAAGLANTLGTDQAELEHAQTWAELARATFVHHGEDLDIEAEVRSHLGELAMAAGDYDAALSEYGRALEHARAREGERSRAYIEALRSLGNAHHELGHYAEAGEALERARALASDSLGDSHPMIPAILDALGNLESSQGEFDEALKLHRAALSINEAIYGPNHRRVAKNLNNLAIIHDETGRYGESIETLERARAILVAQLGANHPDVAFVDVNVGSALQNLGRDAEALARYEAALTMLEHSLGPDHMAVGVTLQNLGSVRSSLGDYTGALADYTRAQAVLEQAFGVDHPTLAALEINRALALRSLHRNDEALAADQRALVMREAIFGPDHSELVEVLTSLAKTQRALGDEDQARELAQRALAIVGEGNTATEHVEVRMLLAEQLVADADAEARARAEALVREALAALSGAEGSDELLAEQLEVWLVEQGFESPTLAGP